MFLIGKSPFGKIPAIALTLTGGEDPRLIRKAKRQGGAIHEWPLLLELRIDRFPSLEENRVLQKIRSYRALKMPIIATIRSRKEGGGRAVPDSKRLELFKIILPLVDAVDIELGSARLGKVLVPLAHRKRKQVILSYHNFRTTPSDSELTALVRKGKKRGADLVKIAVTPKKKSDVARLLLFTQRNRAKGLISIGMGSLGEPTRVLAPLFGSQLTYSFVGRSQAPGQLSISNLSRELKPFFT